VLPHAARRPTPPKVPVPKLSAGTVSPDNPKRRYSIYILLALIRFGFVSDPLGSRVWRRNEVSTYDRSDWRRREIVTQESTGAIAIGKWSGEVNVT
jgi:hypothetical protein